MLIASIDIGSNTALMLISEVDFSCNSFKAIKNFYEIPRIGKGLQNDNSISEEKIVLLIDILSRFKEQSSQLQCGKIICAATNAMRLAQNQTEICQRVFDATGISIDVISGEEEATLSYLGAVSAKPRGRYLVIDIGGGSTELIFGDNQDIEFKKSFQIGVVSFFEKYISEFPVHDSTISKIEFEIMRQISAVTISDFSNSTTISIAGTPTTLAAINKNLNVFNEETIEGDILTIEEIQNQIQSLKNMKPEEILSQYSEVVKGREDLILVGAVILSAVMSKLNIRRTIVSTRGIRYGLVQKFINESAGKI